jgi:response regulator RpfG family c-di-GMP phosphodiesterase
MKILIVEDDSTSLSFLARELQSLGYEVVQTQFGDRGLDLYKKHGPWASVLSNYKFFPGVEIKNGAELVTAIHAINPSQRMAIMTAWCEEAREKLPQALRFLPVLEKPFRFEQVLRLLRERVLPL